MAQPMQMPPPGFDELTVEHQIDYVQSLWDRIADKASQAPLEDWQDRLLEERLRAHRAAPDSAKPWEEVLDRVENRLRQLSSK